MWRLLCAVSKLATGAELAVSCREKPALWGPEEPCPVLAAPPLGLYGPERVLWGSCGGCFDFPLWPPLPPLSPFPFESGGR